MPRRVTADPAVTALLEVCLTWAFRSVGVTVAVVPAGPTTGDHPDVRVSVGGPRLASPFDYVRQLAGGWPASHSARAIFDDVQNYLDEGAMWGRAVPPCGAHPRHPADLEVEGPTVRLRCTVDAASWFEDYPGRLDVGVTARAE